MADGRPACHTTKKHVSLTEDQRMVTPFCGACLLVLMGFRLHSETLWATCGPPDMRPSEALELLRKTPVARLWDLSGIAGTDTWWFERTAEN